jgi:hypothetical protein
VTDRAAGRVNGAHKSQAYQLRRVLSIQDCVDVAAPVVFVGSFVASVLA